MVDWSSNVLSIAVELTVSSALGSVELATDGTPPSCGALVSIGASLMSPPGADTVDQEFALPLDGLFVVFEEATGGGMSACRMLSQPPRTRPGTPAWRDVADVPLRKLGGLLGRRHGSRLVDDSGDKSWRLSVALEKIRCRDKRQVALRRGERAWTCNQTLGSVPKACPLERQ